MSNYGYSHLFQRGATETEAVAFFDVLEGWGLFSLRSGELSVQVVDDEGDVHYERLAALRERLGGRGGRARFKTWSQEDFGVTCTSSWVDDWLWWKIMIGSLNEERLPLIRNLIEWFEGKTAERNEVAMIIDPSGETEEADCSWDRVVVRQRRYEGPSPDMIGLRRDRFQLVECYWGDHRARELRDYVILSANDLEAKNARPFTVIES
jgi:hypothetical protein